MAAIPPGAVFRAGRSAAGGGVRSGRMPIRNWPICSRTRLPKPTWFCTTKSDLTRTQPRLARLRLATSAAQTGQGVAEWLDEVLSGRLRAGGQLLDIDYARYAAAEAALGWLNWEGELRLETALTPAADCRSSARTARYEDLTRAGAPIAHLKIFDRAPSGYIRGGICANGEEPSVEGDLLASPARRHELVINLRARALPAVLLARPWQALPANLPGVLRAASESSSPPRRCRSTVSAQWFEATIELRSMKALVKSKREPGLWLEDIEKPRIGINDVLIRVHRTGICGTDVHIYKWDDWAQQHHPRADGDRPRIRGRDRRSRARTSTIFIPAISSAAKATWSAAAAATAWRAGAICARTRRAWA